MKSDMYGFPLSINHEYWKAPVEFKHKKYTAEMTKLFVNNYFILHYFVITVIPIVIFA